jgi:hypothetical protein
VLGVVAGGHERPLGVAVGMNLAEAHIGRQGVAQALAPARVLDLAALAYRSVDTLPWTTPAEASIRTLVGLKQVAVLDTLDSHGLC